MTLFLLSSEAYLRAAIFSEAIMADRDTEIAEQYSRDYDAEHGAFVIEAGAGPTGSVRAA